MTPLRICLVAASGHPIREPYAGGLEAHTAALARELARRGHEVDVFAAPGSDPIPGTRPLPASRFLPTEVAAGDPHAPPARWMAEHHAYLELMLLLAREGRQRYDVVHNNSLHHLPVAMAATVPVPVLTTLHTPPVPWLESAIALGGAHSRFVSVSRACQRAWRATTSSEVVRNGVDTDFFTPGSGGSWAVWSGRITPEKAPHEAIDACARVGVPLRLAGPVSDPGYYRDQVRPRLGSAAEHLGHLRHAALVRLLQDSAVALLTPAWDEPYGLVAAEAMACGTPVAAYARGAMPEIVRTESGVLARPADVAALGAAVLAASRLDRGAVRNSATRHCSVRTMTDRYERIYAELARRAEPAA